MGVTQAMKDLSTPNEVAYSERKLGFSLVELLVVIAIIGVLIALLLPAVQAAREASRNTSCKNQLKQIGVGLLTFHDTAKEFPQGGWGRAWVPVSGRGVGKDQPGSWIYRILPNLEEGSIKDAYQSESRISTVNAVNRLLGTSISILNCPSRRTSQVWKVGTRSYQTAPRPVGSPNSVAKTDYAINSGTSHAFRRLGPSNLAEGYTGTYWDSITDNHDFTGISHLHRSVSLKKITDGTSKTFLVGEKYLPLQDSLTGLSAGDDNNMYSGYALDNHRFAASRPVGPPGASAASISFYRPARDGTFSSSPTDRFSFGSAHPGGLNMLYCDGSVRKLVYEIDDFSWYTGANRQDGESLLQ